MPGEKRLRGYQEQNLPAIEQSLASTASISRPPEIRQLTLATLA
jgi:hypothetical protein